MPKQIINTAKAPAPIGPYNQAVKAGDLLFVSGQIPIDPLTNELITGSIKDEPHQSMKNIQAILTVAGLSFEHIVKTSIFIKDMNNFAAINEVYAGYFSSNFPARETVEVARLPKDVRVEISVIASGE